MNSTSFAHDFAHALPARSLDDEYRQIERMYGPRTSWRFVRQTLSISDPPMLPNGSLAGPTKQYDIVTIRRQNGEMRDIYFDVSNFAGTWPDHAAGRILTGAEMNVSDITGAGQASDLTPPPSNKTGIVIAGAALVLAWGAWVVLARRDGEMPMTRTERRLAMMRSNPCGCQHGG
ncbi:MAG: hypothetical protein ABI837_08815 [Acidobacteriota bacterium]